LPQLLAGSLLFLVLIGGLGLSPVARLPFAADERLTLVGDLGGPARPLVALLAVLLGLALRHALSANPVS
jgi:hypothetical protein